MSLEVILPIADRTADVPVPVSNHVWKALPAKPVIGLIDNTKARASDLLEAIGVGMVKRGLAESYFMIRKPHAGVTITESDRQMLLTRAHMVVAGVGD